MGVGRRLREARDAKGLTLTAVAERTKIPARQLRLLENEEYGELPGGIFVRGYVRAVATQLGLDPQRMLEEFRRETQPLPPPVAAPQGPAGVFDTASESLRLRLAPEDDIPREDGWNGRMLALVLIAVSVILVILWLRRDAPGVGAERPAAAVDGAVTSEPLTAAPIVERAVDTLGTLPDAPLAADRPLVVRVEATARCWVALLADGQRVAYRMFQAGDAVTAEARRELVLRTGNPALVQLTVNGERAERMQSARGVQTLELTPANYRAVLGLGD